jgi:hypothetical protein
MSATPENFDRATKRKSASLAISLCLHGLLLLLAVLLFSMFRPATPDEPLRRGSIVLTSIDENQKEEFLTKDDIEETLDDPTVAAAAAASQAAPSIDIPQIETLPGPPLVDPSPNATEIANESFVDQPSHQYELSKEQLDEIAREQRRLKSRQPKGDPISINVFNGTKMSGRRFVFILDRSQSMGGDGLGVLFQAQKELTAAVSQLQPNHEFQIVAYHSRTVTVSERRMLTASEKNKALVKPFMERLAAFGATEHSYGINAGLAFRPDSVVLLTDGGYPGLTASELKQIRKAAGKAEFHCIQFGLGKLQKPADFMTRLASQGNGTFRYINVRDWEK